MIRVEVEKTRRAYEIGRNCGLFRVPQVLEYDETAGMIVLERLDVEPVVKAVSWGEKRCELAKILGVSLAIIHRELTLPDGMLVPLPEEFAFPYDEVFLHGDLSVDNVCVGSAWPPITILDWQMTPCYGGRATYGTRYFDILWFIYNQIIRPSTRFLFSNPVAPVIKAFMDSYFNEARLPYDVDKFARYAMCFSVVLMTQRRHELLQEPLRKARFLLPRIQSISRIFLKSLETYEPTKQLTSSQDEKFGR